MIFGIEKKHVIITLFIVLALMLLLVFTFNEQGFYTKYKLNKKLSDLEIQIDSLRKLNDSLAVENELLQKSLFKIEKVARERYGLIKPGEKVFKIRIRE